MVEEHTSVVYLPGAFSVISTVSHSLCEQILATFHHDESGPKSEIHLVDKSFVTKRCYSSVVLVMKL